MNNKCFLLVVGLVLVLQGCGVYAAAPIRSGATVAQCKASQSELFMNPLIATKQTNYHNLVISKCVAKVLTSDHNVDCDFTSGADDADTNVEQALAEYLASCSSTKGQSNIVVTSTVNFHHKNRNIQATISWFQCMASSCSVETHLPYIVASRVREVTFGAAEVTAPEGYTVDYTGGLKFKISSNEAVYPPYYGSSSSYPYGYSSSSSYPYGYSSSSSYPYGYSSSSSYYGYSSSSSYPYGYSSSSSYYGYSSSSSYPYGYSSSSSYPYGYSSSSSYPYGYSSSSSYPYGYSSSSSYPYGYSSSSSYYGYSSSSSYPYGYSSSSYSYYDSPTYYGEQEEHNNENHHDKNDHHNKHNKEHGKPEHHNDHKGHKNKPNTSEDLYSFEFARRFIPIIFISMFLVVILWALLRRRQANRKYEFLEPTVCHKV